MTGMPALHRRRVEQPLPHNRHRAFIRRTVEGGDAKLVETRCRRPVLPGLL